MLKGFAFPVDVRDGKSGELLVTTIYYIVVSKPGYKEIVMTVEGSKMKSVWHWNLEPIGTSTPQGAVTSKAEPPQAEIPAGQKRRIQAQ